MVRQPGQPARLDDAHLINAALDIHGDDPAFGYRFIADELRRRGSRACRTGSGGCARQQRIWSVHAKKRGLNRKAGPPVHDDLVDRAASPHRDAEPAVADRHHRAPHRRGQALPVRDQGRLLQPDRRLLHRLADDRLPRRRRAAQRHRPARSGRHHRALGPRQPVPLPRVRPGAARTTACAARWAGSAPAATTPRWSRSSPAAEERPRPPALADPRANSAWRSSPGSRRPTTADAAKTRLGRLTPIEYETLLQAAHAA